MKPVICLMGPTASGKTSLAIELAQIFPLLQIISVDSAMVYRGLDIGTAKPSPAILKVTPHRLINICEPTEIYSAGQFVEDAIDAINDIHQAGKVPLLIGGTMLYFNVLQKGLAPMPAASPEIRTALQSRALAEGWSNLHAELMIVDPDAGTHIKESDSQRIQRALEVFFNTGKPISLWQKEHTHQNKDYAFYNLAVNLADRANLHTRIELRFNNMLQTGLMDEVKRLYGHDDLNSALPALRSVGYRQVWGYLSGKLTDEQMREQAIAATRQLAKRQLTWLRKWPNLEWFISDDANIIEKLKKRFREIL